jgi:hypothetical protein
MNQSPITLWALWDHDRATWLRGKDTMANPIYCFTNQIDAAQAAAALEQDYNVEPRPFMTGTRTPRESEHAHSRHLTTNEQVNAYLAAKHAAWMEATHNGQACCGLEHGPDGECPESKLDDCPAWQTARRLAGLNYSTRYDKLGK